MPKTNSGQRREALMYAVRLAERHVENTQQELRVYQVKLRALVGA
jgi:predicted HTH domain antitoxin